ncbi:hypothetical protein ATANTOWER_012148, partial [Ataeniobius toweri]|nr:hypothetical protein [Ataeniobius toweri]
ASEEPLYHLRSRLMLVIFSAKRPKGEKNQAERIKPSKRRTGGGKGMQSYPAPDNRNPRINYELLAEAEGGNKSNSTVLLMKSLIQPLIK